MDVNELSLCQKADLSVFTEANLRSFARAKVEIEFASNKIDFQEIRASKKENAYHFGLASSYIILDNKSFAFDEAFEAMGCVCDNYGIYHYGARAYLTDDVKTVKYIEVQVFADCDDRKGKDIVIPLTREQGGCLFNKLMCLNRKAA